MYYKKGDEVEVVDDFKLDGVLKGHKGVYQEHLDSNDISISICKIIIGGDKVVFIPEVSIKHTDPVIAKERYEAVGKQAEEFAKKKGIDINAEKGIIYANDIGISGAHPKDLTYFPNLSNGESETTAKPTRYNTGDIEVWDAIRLLGLDYMQGNVVKYTSRYRNKNGSQDLFKAMNYLVKIMSTELDLDFYDLRTKTVDELSVICDKRKGNDEAQEVS